MNKTYPHGRSTIFLFCLLFMMGSAAHAQDIDDDELSIRSTLINFSNVDFNFEFYKFGSNQFLLSQTGNGTLKINENSFLNMEYNISNAWLRNSSNAVPGDFSFSYIYNYYNKQYGKKGFQGIAVSLKLILPTGRSEFLSGFDNWILEPAGYFGWRLNDERTYFAFRIRANFSLGALPEAAQSFPFGRFEAIAGYETNKFWAALTIDNRQTLDNWQHNLLLKGEAGYKFNNLNGIFTSFTYRIIGLQFFQYFLGLGYYRTF